jgi:hypothetical protein
MQGDPWPFYLVSMMMAGDAKARPTAENPLTILDGMYTSKRCNCMPTMPSSDDDVGDKHKKMKELENPNNFENRMFSLSQSPQIQSLIS